MACIRSRRSVVGTLVLMGLVLSACGSDGEVGTGAGSTAPPPTTATRSVATPAPSTSTVGPLSSVDPTTVPPPTAPPTTEPAAATDPLSPDSGEPPPSELDRAGDAGQAVVVTADGYGSTTATLTTWQQSASGWRQVHGPWPAYVGYAGFAPPGEKREGDGRTPSGTFGFEFAFGIEPDPGVAIPYRRVTGSSIVWDDVPSSPSYNQWVDGGVGEAMYQSPVYDYAAVIAYNTARTPGLGSAIFLHVSRGNPTAGCVSLPVDQLLAVLRWLDPAEAPVIVMGVG